MLICPSLGMCVDIPTLYWTTHVIVGVGFRASVFACHPDSFVMVQTHPFVDVLITLSVLDDNIF
jgi:hypothetical protein